MRFVERNLALQVAAIATLKDVLQVLRDSDDPALVAHFTRVEAYRERYGVA